MKLNFFLVQIFIFEGFIYRKGNTVDLLKKVLTIAESVTQFMNVHAPLLV